MKSDFVKNYAIIILLLGLTANAFSDTPEQKLQSYFYRKCSEVSGDGGFKFEKLRTDVYELGKYLSSTFKDLPQSKNYFCGTERGNLNARIDVVSSDLKSCLYGDERFLAQFVRVSFKEFLHFLCHKNGQNMDIFFGPDGRDCRDRIERSMNTTDIDRCFGRIFAPLSGKLTKKETCDDVVVAEKCFATSLEVHCPQNGRMKQLNEDFFRYIRTPCAGCGSFYFSIFVLAFCHVFLFVWK